MLEITNLIETTQEKNISNKSDHVEEIPKENMKKMASKNKKKITEVVESIQINQTKPRGTERSVKLYHCEKCSKRFRTTDGLTEHIVTYQCV